MVDLVTDMVEVLVMAVIKAVITDGATLVMVTDMDMVTDMVGDTHVGDTTHLITQDTTQVTMKGLLTAKDTQVTLEELTVVREG